MPSSVRLSMMRSTALTGGLLVEARIGGALGEHGLDLGELDAARLEHNEQMIKQVGCLGDQVLAILGYGGKGGLHRLLAELLGAMRHALVEQFAGVRLLSR